MLFLAAASRVVARVGPVCWGAAGLSRRLSNPAGLSRWTAVDDYFDGKIAPESAAKRLAREDGAASGFPEHEVSASQGKFLQVLLESVGGRRVLEIGTLAGYSTSWFAESAEEVVSLEVEPERAALAAANLERAGLAEKVRIVVGPAATSLEALPEDEPFDFIFVDADKPSNPLYFAHALRLSRPGTLIVADNVVRDGEVVDGDSTDDRVQGVRAFVDLVEREPRVTAAVLQTVGRKGWDGFMLLRVTK